jgi:hypothetical protein
MPENHPDLRTVLALFAVLAAATLFTGSKLEATTIPGAVAPFPAIIWLLATTFLAAMALCAAVAALGVGVSTIAHLPVPSWNALARLAFDFSLWLLYWLGIWGSLFVFSFVLFLEAHKFYPTVIAALFACATAAGSTVVVMKALPRDLRAHMRHLNPYTRYGLVPGLLLFFIFLQFGHFVARSYHVFDLTLGSREVVGNSPLRVEARASGHILNLDSLRIRIEPVNHQTQSPTPVQLTYSDAGQFLAWVSVADLAPGTYRVVLYFHNFAHASPIQRLALWYNTNNQLVRSATFQVMPPRITTR